MDVLLSIKPVFAERILSGEKSYEFRRRLFKRHDVNMVYLYANSEVRRITAGFHVKGILEGHPKDLWRSCAEQAGVSRELYDGYFEGRDRGFALEIGDVWTISPCVNPFEEFEAFTPPQSFMYLKEKQSDLLSSRLFDPGQRRDAL